MYAATGGAKMKWGSGYHCPRWRWPCHRSKKLLLFRKNVLFW